MIRILFDHQYLETNNIDIYNFYNELIKKLKEIKEFHIIEAHNRKELISFINGNYYDIYHATGLSSECLSLINKSKKLVINIQDMIPEYILQKCKETENELSKLIEQKAQLIFLAHKIIVPSEVTRKYLYSLYKRWNNVMIKTKIINCGIELEKTETDNIPIINGKYFVYIGERISESNYKNLPNLYRNLIPFLQENPKYKLVLIGNKLDKYEEDLFKNSGIIDQIIVHNFCGQNEMANIYKHAKLSIFPSTIEGFSYELLNSWKNDCIALLNVDNPVFKEIAGEFGVYVDINNIKTSLNNIKSLNIESRKILIENQHKQLKNYDLNKIINKYIEMYKDLYNE